MTKRLIERPLPSFMLGKPRYWTEPDGTLMREVWFINRQGEKDADIEPAMEEWDDLA